MKTAQQVFDHTLTHLRKQGRAAMDDAYRCLYRNGRGDSCAAGCHIRDEDYIIEMEQLSAAEANPSSPDQGQQGIGLRALGVAFRNSGALAHLQLLADLQRAHDEQLRVSLPYWEQAMVRIAANHYLAYTPPVDHHPV